MTKIQIRWLSDDHDCETCGWSYAEGAEVIIDGVPFPEDLTPHAHCFGGAHFTSEEVFQKILEHLGHTVEEIN